VSHITSATGLRFPAEEVCSRARTDGILSAVDGAHAPGQIDLDLEALGGVTLVAPKEGSRALKRVAGYVRVSRVGKRKGDSFQSPPAQEDAIRAHCRARGLHLVEVVRELDESGGTMQRPKLQRLIREVEARKLAGIIVARIDRFARTLIGGVAALEQIHAAGGFVQTVEGGIDTSTSGGAMGELQLNLLLTLAQWERTTRAEGFEAAKQRAVARGVHISGTVPVGYLRPAKSACLELDPDKHEAVCAAFDLRASGASYGEVVALLDRMLPGGPSGHGAWNRNTITRLLSNRVYLGEARQGVYVQEGAHPAVVSREVFDTVQALALREQPTTSPSARSLLAGLVRCGCCSYALDRNKVGKHYVVYRCRGRSASGVCDEPTSAMADALEAFVEQAVLDRLGHHRVEQVASDSDVSDLHAALAAARAKRVPFEDPEYVAALGRDAALRALRKVDDEIARWEGELAERVAPARHDGRSVQEVRRVWPTLTTDERREVIASMIDAITVSRAPRGVALGDRVRLVWKDDGVPVARPSRGRRKRPELEARLAAAEDGARVSYRARFDVADGADVVDEGPDHDGATLSQAIDRETQVAGCVR